MSKLVSLTYLNDYNDKVLENAIKDAIAQVGVASFFKPKMKVLIKVCLPDAYACDSAETTHPAVVRAVANWLKEMDVECIVAESPYKRHTQENLEKVYLNTGMLDSANQTICVLNKDLSTFKVETPSGVMAKNLTLLDVVNKVDAIINVGKLKIEENFGYMGVCSNLFGFVPGEIKTQVLSRLNTQKDFNNYILDIYNALKDKIIFNVLDGIVAQECGDTQRMMCCLAVSDNMFSLDAAMIDILNIGYKNTILKQAKARGLFEFEKGYKIVGDKLEKFKVQDFAMLEINETTPLFKNKNEQNKLFKNLQPRPRIQKVKCKGCGICAKVCPTGAITMQTDKNGELYAKINYAKCIFCNKCHTACPYSVVDIINPAGNKKIMKELEKQNEGAN